MNNKCLAPLLIVLTLTLAACSDDKKGNYTGLGDDASGNLPGDNVGGGIPPADRGNFNPETDVDYQTLASNTVYFAFDSSNVGGPERGKLEQVHQWMVANPGHELYLAGHADKRGTPEYNRALGERRAQAVREYLVGLGLRPGDLHTNSYGSDRPAVQGDNEDAYAKNRRVEIGVVIRK